MTPFILSADQTLSLEEFEDTKWVITIHKETKDRQHYGQKKKKTRINNDLHITTEENKDRATRTPYEQRG